MLNSKYIFYSIYSVNDRHGDVIVTMSGSQSGDHDTDSFPFQV